MLVIWTAASPFHTFIRPIVILPSCAFPTCSESSWQTYQKLVIEQTARQFFGWRLGTEVIVILIALQFFKMKIWCWWTSFRVIQLKITCTELFFKVNDLVFLHKHFRCVHLKTIMLKDCSSPQRIAFFASFFFHRAAWWMMHTHVPPHTSSDWMHSSCN